MKKKTATEEQALKDRIMDIFNRSTSGKGLTEGSVSAILALETEIAICKALVNNLLDGSMAATYPGPVNNEEDMLLDLFKYRLTTEGTKRVSKLLKDDN